MLKFGGGLPAWSKTHPLPTPSMSSSSTFFTTTDGDVILHAGPEPNSKHDFRVHKLILSLASPVFKDMFAFPQPPDQTLNEQQLSIVDILESPKVIDTILRLVYPGVEPPKIVDIPTLSASLSAADKYNITSIYPVFKDTLKTFLPHHSFGVYVVACRFGFVEEAKKAAKLGNTQSIMYPGLDEEVRHISSTDLLRWVRFVQERETKGREITERLLDWDRQDEGARCAHGEGGETFYSRLEKAVGNAFASNPSVGRKDLFDVLDTVPDSPPGCKPPSMSAEFYRDYGEEEVFNCPLLPMTIRHNLVTIAVELEVLNRSMLDQAFREGDESS